MGITRQREINYLTNLYEADSSKLAVVYGQKHMGKTMLIKNFLSDKDSIYYLSREVSEREQCHQLSEELLKQGYRLSDFAEYKEVFDAISRMHLLKKVVLVFDEFQNMIKAGNAFMEALVEFLQEDTNALVVLISSSIGFVENSLVKRIGRAVYSISGFLKIKELTFQDVSGYYKTYTFEQLVETYGILGGITGYLPCFDKTRSTKENVCEFILKNNTFLNAEGSRILTEELREPAVYYSILAAMASGKRKLNDIYKHTGFSRAKISVYLKSLMELEMVEKVFSFDAKGKENVQKGLYQISHPYVHFWFKFIYPNLSSLSMMNREKFYESYVAPKFREYCSGYFSKICREYVEYLNEKGKLCIHYEQSGSWAGKDGNIDLLASDAQGRTVAVFTKYDKGGMTYGDYIGYMHLLQQAKVTVHGCYLFSMWGFDEKLQLEAKVKVRLYLKNVKEEPIRFT